MKWWEWIAALWWLPFIIIYAFNFLELVHGEDKGRET